MNKILNKFHIIMFPIGIIVIQQLFSPILLAGNIKDIKWNIYKSDKYGYEVSYPYDWKIIEAIPVESQKESIKRTWSQYNLYDNELQKVTFLDTKHKMWPGSFQILIFKNNDSLSINEWAIQAFTDELAGCRIEEQEEIMLSVEKGIKYTVFAYDSKDIEILLNHSNNILNISYSDAPANDPDNKYHNEIYTYMVENFKFISAKDN